jgi:single-strand DNA-binding protein
MNSCILMARLLEDPQLRYTQESNLEMSVMMVEFSGLRSDEPSSHLRVIGWGNLAKEINESYKQGDRVILEGRLSMNTIERDGYKEKKAELTVQRIYSMTNDLSVSSASSSNYRTDDGQNEESPSVVSMNTHRAKKTELPTDEVPVPVASTSNSRSERKTKAPIDSPIESTDNLDEIPF